ATAAGGEDGTRSRAGRRAARVGAGTGTPRTGAVSTGEGGAVRAWLTRAVSRSDEETGAWDVCQARHGASHHSAAAIANPPTPPTAHQSREPVRACGTVAAAACACGFESTIGLVGVLSSAINAEPGPAFARVIISPRTGSSCRRDGRPHTATMSSMLGQRWAGSFSSIRITPAARLGGQSGRSSATGRGRSLKCAYITDMVELAWNGS